MKKMFKIIEFTLNSKKINISRMPKENREVSPKYIKYFEN